MFSFGSFLMMAQQQGGSGAQGGISSMLTPIIMFAAIILIFYFLMIRPQKKRQQEHQKMLDALKSGDRVITSSGMHGTIEEVTDKTFIIKVDTVKFTFEKSAIVGKE